MFKYLTDAGIKYLLSLAFHSMCPRIIVLSIVYVRYILIPRLEEAAASHIKSRYLVKTLLSQRSHEEGLLIVLLKCHNGELQLILLSYSYIILSIKAV